MVRCRLHPAPVVVALCAAGLGLSLAACGSSGEQVTNAGSASAHARGRSTSAQSAPPAPSALSAEEGREAVAKVGGVVITKAELLHQMKIGARGGEVPVPPHYSACVQKLRAAKGTGPGSGGEARLEAECNKRYQALARPALALLINNQWLRNEGAELGIRVDRGALARELQASIEAGLEKQLASTGRSLADVRAELEVAQFSNGIYEHIDAKTPVLTPQRVRAYYDAHFANYALPQMRDLHIVRTSNLAAAEKIKREIAKGRSFQSVVKSLAGVAQPIGAKEGLVEGLTYKRYSEPVLAKAIFRAHPHVLTGPVQITLGFFVFEVLSIHPPRQMPLKEAAASIERELPTKLHNLTRVAAVKEFKRKWTARTDCTAGYVVSGCRQYKPSGLVEEASEDPYVL
jgi:parvulin-like peptidyl-prolyl isomerase